MDLKFWILCQILTITLVYNVKYLKMYSFNLVFSIMVILEIFAASYTRYNLLLEENAANGLYHPTLDGSMNSSTSNVNLRPNVQLHKTSYNQIILKCHMECSSAQLVNNIQWFHNNEKLKVKYKYRNIKVRGNHLVINKPKFHNNGLYRCSASNLAGGHFMSKKNFLLIYLNLRNEAEKKNNIFLLRGKRGDISNNVNQGVTHGPIKNVTIKESEYLEIECERYVPAVRSRINLHWRKDGKVIELDHTAFTNSTERVIISVIRDESRLFISRQNGSLIFNNVISSDAGKYTCEIATDDLQPLITTSVKLQVIEKLKFVPHPTSKNLELGSLGKVHCKAQGTPSPQVKWVKDSKEPFPDSIEDVNGTLIFKNVSFENRGNFTCIATNDQGVINATVNINVVVAPRFIILPEDALEFLESETAIVHCHPVGDPKPTIQWDKDLEYFKKFNNTDPSHRIQLLENGTLIIQNIQHKDEGIYGCTIGNSAGLKRKEVKIIVKVTDGDNMSDGLITRAVLITMSVALAYIILVIGLMIWCRYKRQARKARFNETVVENDGGGNRKVNIDEHQPCLPDINLLHISTKRGKCNGDCNIGNSVIETQKSDDTACSNQSKMSKKCDIYELYSLPRSIISELILIGSGDFGNVFIGKIKSSLLKQFVNKENTETDKQSNINNDNINSCIVTRTLGEIKTRSKTSMDDIDEIREEHRFNIIASKSVEDEKLVMVKALNKVKDDFICLEFKRQIEMFRIVTHKSVVKFFGLCRDQDPHYMILEYSNWGDLKEFLLATAGKIQTTTNASTSPPPLKTGQVLAAAYQIARGMDAIYRARFVHKDLATRNCIISSDFIVKVSYPAVCVDKYSKEYFKYHNLMLPIRWLPTECILEDDYSIKSDVYSFGVVVWELFTQATKLPFEDLSNDEVIKNHQVGKLELQCAESTPECLRDILYSCWNTNPKERPSFNQLCSALSNAMQSLNE